MWGMWEGCRGDLSGHGRLGDLQESCQHFVLTLGPESSQTLPPGSTAVDITGLRPGTSYQVAVSALRGREEGPPALTVASTGQALRRPLALLLRCPSDPCLLRELCSPSGCLPPLKPLILHSPPPLP